VDLILMAVGGGLSFWGWRLRDPNGLMTQAGKTMLVVGAATLAIGAIIFAVAFAIGFSEGLRSG